MPSWSATRTQRGDVLVVAYAGLVTNATVHSHWTSCEWLGVTVFDFRRATTIYTSTPTDANILRAQRSTPAAIVCTDVDHPMFAQRADALNALGVRRMVFLSLALALEWAREKGVLSLARTAQRKREQCAPSVPDL